MAEENKKSGGSKRCKLQGYLINGGLGKLTTQSAMPQFLDPHTTVYS